MDALKTISDASLKQEVPAFALHSPVVDRVEVIRKGKVRRAKLYYLRDRVGKAAKVKEQIR